MMYPTNAQALGEARLADFHREAQRTALARAARHARPHHSSHPQPALPARARQALAVLGTRGS